MNHLTMNTLIISIIIVVTLQGEMQELKIFNDLYFVYFKT